MGKIHEWADFFGFFVNMPKGAELTIDKVPAYTEAWDVEDRSYSITLPVNPLRVRKHEFIKVLMGDGRRE